MSKFDPSAEPHTVYIRVDPDITAGHPTVVFAKPKKDEVYRLYIGTDIKVRKLNSGIVQIATGEGGWHDA